MSSAQPSPAPRDPAASGSKRPGRIEAAPETKRAGRVEGAGSSASGESGERFSGGRRRGRRRRGRGGSGKSGTTQAAAQTPSTRHDERHDDEPRAPRPGPKPVADPPLESDATQHHPKPSDLVAAAGKRAKTSAGAGKQRGDQPRGDRNRNRSRTAPRLRTMRETSAGGLVVSDLSRPYDELSAVLIGRVDRRGRMMWSLPKGHIETGETAEQTAIREVAEETGISGSVVAPLGKIDYWFVSEGRRIHKTVHHYLLRSTGGELSDADYEVAEVAWVPLVELPKRLTYSDERRLARMAEGVIAELTADPGRLAQSEADSIRTEPNDYEKAAAARNQRRKDPVPPPPSARRRRRRGRRPPPTGD
ncbi:NUDIX hydrolase [Gordonia sp. X0973]|uniref:NUDIX hydrolase n=1 Tax=Gordonia sp. X0973 TaxID=2742602 RepID=UPI0026575816|nr:NUDIX hydrolase [Gordonia sp. X0973]